MRTPSFACSWWKRTVFGDVALYSLIGTLTSPKLIAPLQIARGMGRFYYPRAATATRERGLASSNTRRRGAERVAHALQRATQQARDVHLRDADALGDLPLRKSGKEAQQQDAPLALAQRAQPPAQLDALLRGGEGRIHGADPRDWLAVIAERLVERDRAVGLSALQRFEHLLGRRAGCLCEVFDSRGAAELRRQAVNFAGDARAQLLQAARNADRPGAIAEVALDLAKDRRHGERREAQLAAEVEAIDRLDEADAADLLEVIERLATVGVPTGERAHKRHHAFDQEAASLLIALLVPATEQLMLVDKRIDRQANDRGGHAVPPSWAESAGRSRLWVILSGQRGMTRWTDTVTGADASAAVQQAGGQGWTDCQRHRLRRADRRLARAPADMGAALRLPAARSHRPRSAPLCARRCATCRRSSPRSRAGRPAAACDRRRDQCGGDLGDIGPHAGDDCRGRADPNRARLRARAAARRLRQRAAAGDRRRDRPRRPA